MATAPSEKRLIKAGIDKETAKKIRAVLHEDVHPSTIMGEKWLPWYRQFYRPPSKAMAKMAALNVLLEGYGVEFLGREDVEKPGWDYVNTGDTYSTTILRREGTSTYFLGTWGDVAKRL